MNKQIFSFITVAALLQIAALAHGNVDFNNWTQNRIVGTGTDCLFTTSTDGSIATFNTGTPMIADYGRSVFISASNNTNSTLQGTVKVNTTADDDFFGFVIGYNDGDYANPAADYLLVDWKQASAL